MKNTWNSLALIATVAGTAASPAFGYEEAYEPTANGAVEVKTLPEATAFQAESEQSYFEEAGGLFMRLYRFIERNDITMTVPVEADLNPGRMRFFSGAGSESVSGDATVAVTIRPVRSVVSAGLQGGYTEERFRAGKRRAEEWLSGSDQWVADGDAYAVFWNAPYVPNWFKRSEVHIPVRPRTKDE